MKAAAKFSMSGWRHALSWFPGHAKKASRDMAEHCTPFVLGTILIFERPCSHEQHVEICRCAPWSTRRRIQSIRAATTIAMNACRAQKAQVRLRSRENQQMLEPKRIR